MHSLTYTDSLVTRVLIDNFYLNNVKENKQHNIY